MATIAPQPAQSGILDGGPTTLVEHFWRQVRTRPDAVAMYFRASDRWAPITWSQFGSATRRLMAVLLAEGVEPGDHVAVWAQNRPEWHIADAAVLSARARPVPVYLTLSAEQAAYVLSHSESAVAFVEGRAQLDALMSVRDQLPRLRRIVVMSGVEEPDEEDFVLPWTVALHRGEALLDAHGEAADARIAAVQPDDVATLIYTSGTTGPPKAVKLTHRNVAAAVAAVSSFVPADPDDRILSYLPLAHIAERMNSEFRQYVFGNPTYFLDGLDRLGERLADVRPTLFFAVPRVWEKIAARVRAQVDGATGMRGRLITWALRTGASAVTAREQGRPLSGLAVRRLALADRLVLRKLRAAIGLDQANIVASGAAPIDPEVLRFYASFGLEVLEVYGQTEDTGLTTMNRPGAARIGTVGTTFPGIELHIAEDGEILVKGDVVFAGYHKDDAATAEALEGGWLHTGDVGELDAGGYLRITDRKKDLIITAGGKNIAPSNIESALKRHPLIGNAVAIGDRRPFVSALITLDPAEAAAWAAGHGVSARDPESLAGDAAVRAELQRHVDAVNAALSHVEGVKRWALLPNDFSVGEELTPTLKVKRKVVAQKYADIIEAQYGATE